MSDTATLLTIVLMAASTYATRIIGYLALQGRALSPRTLRVLENVPGCVLISVIAPSFVSPQPANILGFGITLLAATRLPILPTVIISITTTGLLRHFLGS